mgnify:CR=1 FL=1
MRTPPDYTDLDAAESFKFIGLVIGLPILFIGSILGLVYFLFLA